MSMLDNVLDGMKGWPSPYALDKSAAVAAGETPLKGQVMSLNASGQFVAGLSEGAMAIFALNSYYDFDVIGDDGNFIVGADGVGIMSGLVATGAYELQVTGFDATETYPVNSCLTAGAVGTEDAGELRPGVAYVDTVCGVVSGGKTTNADAKNVLQFWPVWLPPMPSTSA
jgi:hypothetical protein